MRVGLTVFILLCGCQRGQHHDIVGIDPAFQPYYDEFGAIYKMYVGVPIGFVNQPSPRDGVCMVLEDGYRQIEVDPKDWQGFSELERKALVFHELGHCVFGRTHNRWPLVDGCPYSIMNPVTLGDWCMSNHFDHYVNELPYSKPGDYL